MSLITEINLYDIKCIFPNNDMKLEYLKILSRQTGVDFDNIETTRAINRTIIDTWDYEISKNIIRNIFTHSTKYIHNRDCKNRLYELLNQWDELELGEFEWPFLPIRFDQHVHILNRRNLTEEEKDYILSRETIKYRRIKDINAIRNDYIEYLIFEHNENILPTLGNVRGVDFYINGKPYDQKVGRSVGSDFVEEYGADYRQIAIENPNLVAINLYKSQDEARFGDEPRLLVVYLDNDLEMDDIESSFENINFDNPSNIEFQYKHSDGRITSHQTQCFVILLHR